MSDLAGLVEALAAKVDLVVTGDHGYIFLGDNPGRYLWGWKRLERHGESYGDLGIRVGDVEVAVGRFHAPDVRGRSVIAHGGVSLAESLVPVTLVRRGG